MEAGFEDQLGNDEQINNFLNMEDTPTKQDEVYIKESSTTSEEETDPEMIQLKQVMEKMRTENNLGMYRMYEFLNGKNP